MLFTCFDLRNNIRIRSAHFRNKSVKVADRRIRLVNELLSCVKLIKMYAWEQPFFETIKGNRAQSYAKL